MNTSFLQVGDIITSIHKTPLVAGGRDVIVYTGLSGTLGMLIPLQSREDVDFFQTLEMHMRSESSSLVGRDHLAYRGYYVPQKAVIDGDLCESYANMPQQKQANVAQELGRSIGEVLKKVDSIRIASSGW